MNPSGRALDAGFKLEDFFRSFESLRKEGDRIPPLVAMVSFSIVFRYGTRRFVERAAKAGFAGMIVPSARWSGLNLVLFTDRLEPGALDVRTQEPVDWAAWRRAREERG